MYKCKYTDEMYPKLVSLTVKWNRKNVFLNAMKKWLEKTDTIIVFIIDLWVQSAAS